MVFSTVIRQEGVNPYVDPPPGTGRRLGRKGVVPVRVLLDGRPFLANLMPLGAGRTNAKPGTRHRLYLNGLMRRKIGKETGQRVSVVVRVDRRPRIEPMNPALARRLRADAKARRVFAGMRPSRRKELNRYLNRLKSPAALRRNVDKVHRFLTRPRATWFGRST